MASQWWSDDDQLLDALDSALRRARDVPRSFVEAGRTAYAWRDIDAELAALVYDSELEQARAPALMRAEPAPLRALTFASSGLTIELEVTHDALLGQVVPPQPGEIELHVASGQIVIATIDEIGYFVVRPLPTGSFRLRCGTADGASVMTDWVVL